jgi:hypothetical protein
MVHYADPRRDSCIFLIIVRIRNGVGLTELVSFEQL